MEVVSAPARLWERSARCFVVKLCVLERLVAICSVFWRIDDSGFRNLQKKETNRLGHTYCGQSFFLRYGSFKTPCRRGRLEAIRDERRSNGGHAVDGGSRL